MKRRTKAILALAVLLAALVGVAYWARGQIAMATMSRLYDRAMGGDPFEGLPDGLHVALCGAGSPMPDPTRAGPCVAVVAGRRLFVVDSGPGSTRTLSLMNLPPPRVEAVFLTHFHSDHIGDLGELMLQRWAGGAAQKPMPIYGPTGVEQVVAGFQAAYALDSGYRIAHHGPKVIPPLGFGGEARPFAAGPDLPDVLVVNEADLKVWAFPVSHHPAEPSVGYRFEYKGRKLVVSGDTGPSARLEAAARGADVLAHEALSPPLVEIQRKAAVKAGRANYAAILHDILNYHSTPEQAAVAAKRAGVKELLLYHIIPPLPVRALEGPFLGEARTIFTGPVQVGRDGDVVSMPAGSKEIRHGNRLDVFRF